MKRLRNDYRACLGMSEWEVIELRDIKMRGYAVEEMVGSQWMYGTGIHVTEFTDEYAKETGIKEECFVWTDSGWVEVHKKSIGQYTGLNDKNGCEIYEGDIISRHEGGIHFEGEAISKHVVERSKYGWSPFDIGVGKSRCVYGELYNFIIIGNIHENSELLGDS